MSKVLVKICGITNKEDALWASNLGADLVGLNFYSESPRKVSLGKASEIIEILPPFTMAAAVLVNPQMQELKKILGAVKVPVLQFHGDESPEFLTQVKSDTGLSLWKAVRVKDESSLGHIEDFKGCADVILLDSLQDGQFGGTGVSFDWSLAQRAAQVPGVRIVLSGGLKPENVTSAIQEVRPFGVDACSGVEKEGHPRKKDYGKMKAFIENAKKSS